MSGGGSKQAMVDNVEWDNYEESKASACNDHSLLSQQRMLPLMFHANLTACQIIIGYMNNYFYCIFFNSKQLKKRKIITEKEPTNRCPQKE